MASEVKEESNSVESNVKVDKNDDEEVKDAKESKVKDGDKDKIKNETKKETKQESDKSDDEGGEEDDEDDDDDDDEEVALLDRPVVMTGCRARKKVERLEMSSFSTPKDKQEITEGKGKKLGECPRIEAQIQKVKADDLKPLHKILFNRLGSANEVKRNIRKFSGFPFDKSSGEFNRKKSLLKKMTAQLLKKFCLVLDLERGGTKDDIVDRVMMFLLNPEDSGKKAQASKKKASKEKKKTASKKAKSEKKGKTEKEEEESGEDKEKSDEDMSGESSMGGTDEECPEDDEEVDDDEEEESDEEPKKKSKEVKTPKAKSKAEKGKKEEKKTKASKRKKDDDDASGSSADEPPAKKSKMPTNDEISKLVKSILEKADLQEITMKKVIKQVSDAYPDFDLTNKKAFIKSTIKSVIS